MEIENLIDTERHRELNLLGNDAKHSRQCPSTVWFPEAENFRNTIIDSGTTSQSQNILTICKLWLLRSFHVLRMVFPGIFGWVGRTLVHSLTVRSGMASRTGNHTQTPMRIRDRKKVGIIGIIQPMVFFLQNPDITSIRVRFMSW